MSQRWEQLHDLVASIWMAQPKNGQIQSNILMMTMPKILTTHSSSPNRKTRWNGRSKVHREWWSTARLLSSPTSTSMISRTKESLDSQFPSSSTVCLKRTSCLWFIRCQRESATSHLPTKISSQEWKYLIETVTSYSRFKTETSPLSPINQVQRSTWTTFDEQFLQSSLINS